MLTEKGKFVLILLDQGIRRTLKEYDALWEQHTATKQCDKCNGTGRVPDPPNSLREEDKV